MWIRNTAGIWHNILKMDTAYVEAGTIKFMQGDAIVPIEEFHNDARAQSYLDNLMESISKGRRITKIKPTDSGVVGHLQES